MPEKKCYEKLGYRSTVKTLFLCFIPALNNYISIVTYFVS